MSLSAKRRSVQGVSRAIAGRQQPWAGLLAETTTGLATVTPCDTLAAPEATGEGHSGPCFSSTGQSL